MSLAAIRIRCPITAHFVTDPSTFLIALRQHFVVTACSHRAMQGTCLPMQPHVPQPAWQGASQLLPTHRTGGRQEAGRVKHRVLAPASGMVFFKHCSVTCLPFIIKSTSGCTKHPPSKTEAEPVPPCAGFVQSSARQQHPPALPWTGGLQNSCLPSHSLPLVAGVRPISLHLASVPCFCVGGSLLLGCQESSLPLECTDVVFPLINKHHRGSS